MQEMQDMPDDTTRLRSKFAGRVAARGLMSADVQSAIPKLAGLDLGGVTAVVVESLYVSGVTGVLMPQAVGIKTQDLLTAVKAASMDVANAYHRAGGALTAKGYRTPQEIAEMLYWRWTHDVPAPVPVSKKVDDGLTEEERRSRYALAAQAVQDQVRAMSLVYPYSITEEQLELLCVRAAHAAIRTFDNPNEYIHKRAHGTLD